MIYFVLIGVILWTVLFFILLDATDDGLYSSLMAALTVGLPPLVGYLAYLGMTSL